MIHHVTREIPSSELQRCISFYALLGFREVPAPAGIAGRAVWLERHGTQVHLMPKDQPTAPHGHLGVVVEDYEATLAEARSRGLEVDPRREHWGSPRSYVRDPAGHLCELMAWPPGSARRGE